MKTLYVAIAFLAVAAVASGVELGVQSESQSRLKSRLATKATAQTDSSVTNSKAVTDTDTATATVTDTNMNTDSEIGHAGKSESESEGESETESGGEDNAIDDSEADIGDDEAEAEAEPDGDGPPRLVSVRSRYRIRSELSSSAADCALPQPPLCTMVNWPVAASTITTNIETGVDMVLALQLINFKGSRYCAAWLMNLQCRYLWPDCSKTTGPLPCRTECMKFASNCQGSPTLCDSFPTSNCYVGGISAAPARTGSPLLWLLLVVPTVVLSLWAL